MKTNTGPLASRALIEVCIACLHSSQKMKISGYHAKIYEQINYCTDN